MTNSTPNEIKDEAAPEGEESTAPIVLADEEIVKAAKPKAAKPKAAKKVKVMLLRNVNPGPSAGVAASEFDALGRLRKGTIVELPAALATQYIKSKIASADAAISES